jgi:hypothetical protein
MLLNTFFVGEGMVASEILPLHLPMEGVEEGGGTVRVVHQTVLRLKDRVHDVITRIRREVGRHLGVSLLLPLLERRKIPPLASLQRLRNFAMVAIQASAVRAWSPAALIVRLILRALVVMEICRLIDSCVVKVLPLPRRLPHLLLLDDVSDSLRLMDYVLIFNVQILHERPSYLLPEDRILDWFMR